MRRLLLIFTPLLFISVVLLKPQAKAVSVKKNETQQCIHKIGDQKDIPDDIPYKYKKKRGRPGHVAVILPPMASATDLRPELIVLFHYREAFCCASHTLENSLRGPPAIVV